MQKTNTIVNIVLKIVIILMVGVYAKIDLKNRDTSDTLQKQTQAVNEVLIKLKDLKDPKVNAILGIK